MKSAAKRPIGMIRALRNHLMRRLEAPRRRYERRICNNRERLLAAVRPGDVVLVEGRSEMSRLIQILSNSYWTHAALYVGDRLLREDFPERKAVQRRFGGDARHLLVEAFVGEGVVAAPLRKYDAYNLRLCRPYGISEGDRSVVIDRVVASLGRHYDEQNIVDLALMLLPLSLNPFRRKTIEACLGGCSDFKVICSGLIARAFQKVGYPIVPSLQTLRTPPGPDAANPYGALLAMRHYSQILPRDFDLSPNFEIIKFNIVGQPFDYRSLWVDRTGGASATKTVSNRRDLATHLKQTRI